MRVLYPRAAAPRRGIAGVALVLRLLALTLCVGLGPVSAATLDAYSADVAVSGRNGGEQQEAFELALRQVLLANSGDKTLLNRDRVRAGLADARRFVEQFRYRRPEPGTLIDRDTPVTAAVLASGQATHLLRVSFDPMRIATLTEAGDVPAADVDEPEVAAAEPLSAVVWMLIEDDGQVLPVAGERLANVRRRASEIAGGGGFTLDFPAGDALARGPLSVGDLRALGAREPLPGTGAASIDPRFTDRATASGDEAGGGSPGGAPLAATPDDAMLETRLREASMRYPAPLIVASRLRRGDLSGWIGDWLVLEREAAIGNDVTGAGRQRRFETRTLDEALQAGLAWVSPALGESIDLEQDGAGGPQTSEALVWVGGLASVDAYARTLEALGGVPSVSLVYPKRVEDDGMLFAVVPHTALGAVGAALGGNPAFRRSVPPRASGRDALTAQAELALDYVPR